MVLVDKYKEETTIIFKFDELIENNIEGNYMSVLSPVKNTHLDISSIVVRIMLRLIWCCRRT